MPTGMQTKYHGTDGPIHTSFNDFYQVSGSFVFAAKCFTNDPLSNMRKSKCMNILSDGSIDFCSFCEAAYKVGGKSNKSLIDPWSGDHMGFYSSLAAVDRSTDKGRRSYAATGYLRPNLGRPNLKVLTEALVTKVNLDGNTATGVEFVHNGQKHTVNASKEVILSGGVINSPQILELSGIGDPQVLKEAGVECKVENTRVGANFQDHVLGGMLYNLADGVISMDSMHDPAYAKKTQEQYEKDQTGLLASPGMLMGFVSYASLVSKDELEETIKQVRRDSLAKTDFEKRQEEIIVKQLSDPTFANIQTFCKF